MLSNSYIYLYLLILVYKLVYLLYFRTLTYFSIPKLFNLY
jgi:hypothetical protein